MQCVDNSCERTLQKLMIDLGQQGRDDSIFVFDERGLKPVPKIVSFQGKKIMNKVNE